MRDMLAILTGDEYIELFAELNNRVPKWYPTRWATRVEGGMIKKYRMWAQVSHD